MYMYYRGLRENEGGRAGIASQKMVKMREKEKEWRKEGKN